jgi:hypothetical protein
VFCNHQVHRDFFDHPVNFLVDFVTQFISHTICPTDLLQHNVSNFSGTSDLRGPGSSVGIATDYGLDVPGIESRWGRDFSHTSRPALGLTQPPVQCVPGLSRG